MPLELTVKGIEALTQLLSTDISALLEDVAEQTADKLIPILQTTTGSPPNSHRTGRLENSWSAIPGFASVALTNTTPYATFVQGPQQTAGAARYGWKTEESIVPQTEQIAAELGTQAIDKAFKG